LSCLGVEAVFVYNFCLLKTIGFWGAFLAFSDFLVATVMSKV